MTPSNLWPKTASIFEVGPRDGLQSEQKIFTVQERIELVEKLMDAGLKDIEVGSFVREDRIPQLAKTAEVISGLKSKKKNDVRFWAFIPNQKGLDNAVAAGVSGASLFTACSNTFCQKNVNRSQDELFSELKLLIPQTAALKLKTRVYLSTLVFCPYEGHIKPQVVLEQVKKLADLGTNEIVLSDTTGHANPQSISHVLELLLKTYPAKQFALHLHDTRGLGLSNILRGLEFGLTRFDSSIAGMGGCPYAPGASGNLSTEDLANMLLGMGIECQIDLGLLSKAGLYCEQKLSRTLGSRVLRTFDKGNP